MSDREQFWQAFCDRAEQDASVSKVLEEIRKVEALTGEKQEFDAANLKLPYASADDAVSSVWK